MRLSWAVVLGLVQEVAARWLDVFANVVNGIAQRRVVSNGAAVEVLRLDPFCSARAIDFLERAAEQDQLSSGVELGDLLYDAGACCVLRAAVALRCVAAAAAAHR